MSARVITRTACKRDECTYTTSGYNHRTGTAHSPRREGVSTASTVGCVSSGVGRGDRALRDLWNSLVRNGYFKEDVGETHNEIDVPNERSDTRLDGPSFDLQTHQL